MRQPADNSIKAAFEVERTGTRMALPESGGALYGDNYSSSSRSSSERIQATSAAWPGS